VPGIGRFAHRVTQNATPVIRTPRFSSFEQFWSLPNERVSVLLLSYFPNEILCCPIPTLPITRPACLLTQMPRASFTFPAPTPAFEETLPTELRRIQGQGREKTRTSDGPCAELIPFSCDSRSRQAVPSCVLCREPEPEHQPTSLPRFGVTPGDLDCRRGARHSHSQAMATSNVPH
jgi:hypothetical protein